MSIAHASIVPLIGGETIAQQNVLGSRPEYILTYSVFGNNETHLRNYYKNEVPYHVLDQAPPSVMELKKVQVINTVCPCAGLSSLSPSASTDSKMNQWMYESAKYVLGQIKPEVFWGENAPRLSAPSGKAVADKLHAIGRENGYSLLLYKTKSILHGLSQVRDRTFYFYFKGDRLPVLNYYLRPHTKIEDAIVAAKAKKGDPMAMLTNSKKPSEDPFYRFVLEEIHGGITHKEFSTKVIQKTDNILSYIEAQGVNYLTVSKWMKKNKYDNAHGKCLRMHEKLKAGGNIMRKITEVPKDYIGAFVGHMPTMLTHPVEDRYLSIREALSIMKMPDDFQLLGGLRNLNHICQNVPVSTAEDMVTEIKAVLEGRRDTISETFAVQDNRSRRSLELPTASNTETLDKFLG